MNNSVQTSATSGQFTNSALQLISDLEKGEEEAKNPNNINVNQNEAPDNIDCVNEINLQLEKIVSLADALIVLNHKNALDELFEGTLETMLHMIVDHAEAADAAADKIN